MATEALESRMVGFLTDVVGIEKSLFTDFEFQVERTAMSSVWFPICTVLTYCIAIPMMQKKLKSEISMSLKWILVIHNFFLSAVSTFLGILLFAKVVNMYKTNLPAFEVYCGFTFSEQRGLLTLLYYWNYLLKYYELIDTIFLVLKKKPIGFLHAYHHPATLVLTWTQLVDFSGMQWVVIGLNLWVHSVMYFYYALAALHIPIPFKQIITIFQISQFIIDLVGCYYGTLNIMLISDGCTGTYRAGFVGCFVITSYLYLFVDFYNETYKEDNKKLGIEVKKHK